MHTMKEERTKRILSLEEAKDSVEKCQSKGRLVGLCHGCFDVLHFGHLRHFEAAAKLCDLLVVSVTADRFVNKGPNRPVFVARERAELLSALYCVDFSVISDYPTAMEVLEKLRPNRFFKGSEYLSAASEVNPNFIAERDLAESMGIEVVHTDEQTSSSSKIIEKLLGCRDFMECI
jgi:rfaE bifunctional protein nucleotidyltransferase chain/domain